jgi:hypothetical protein
MTGHRDIDTSERLRFHATNMEREGHLTAARYMRNAADELERLRRQLLEADRVTSILRLDVDAARAERDRYKDRWLNSADLWRPGTYQNGA